MLDHIEALAGAWTGVQHPGALMGKHLSTCGRSCVGEPMCSETYDVVYGGSEDDRRTRYGALPIDVECPQCFQSAGDECVTEFGTKYPRNACHGPRSFEATKQRLLDTVRLWRSVGDTYNARVFADRMSFLVCQLFHPT
jgi:hypothetical protein